MTLISRLASANTYDNSLRNLSGRQSTLASLQENLTAGKKVVRPSDDPTGAAQAERAQTRIERVKVDQRALESQRNSINLAESTLGDVTDALQNFRELVVNAGNGANSPAERKTIANQLAGLRDQILALANRTDTNGQPLFSALGSALAPFVGPQTPPQDYTFKGLPGQAATNEVAIPYALDGESAFMLQPARDGVYNAAVSNSTTATGEIPAGRTLSTDGVVLAPPTVPNGSTYTISNIVISAGSQPNTSVATYDLVETPAGSTTPLAPVSTTGPEYSNASTTIPITAPGLSFKLTGTPATGDTITIRPDVSIFSVLDNAIRDIGSAVNTNAANQAVAQAINNIDIGMGRVSAVRGQAGDLLNRADRITANQDKRSIQLEGDRSRAEDLDMIKGIADFQNQQTGYQAALQSYAQIQKLSLFNYIG